MQLRDEDGRHKAHKGVSSPKVAVPQSRTMADLQRGRLDIPFFASRWLGIDLHPGQAEWANACAERDESGWRPKYLTTVVSAGNRAGKTLVLAVVVFHHVFYKLGAKPPDGSREDSLRWLRSPFVWYHLGVYQETSELVFRELVLILEGSHPAQRGRGCALTSELGPIVETGKKYRGEYPWIKVHQMYGGGEIHFRTTQEKAKALLGKDMNGISFDEAAFELYLTTIYQEVLNLRRLSTGGPLHFIGTPTEGLGEYYEIWESGNPENPKRDKRVRSFRLSTRDNVGYGIDGSAFEEILRQQEPYLIPQNIDGFFIEATDAYFNAEKVQEVFTDLPIEGQPTRGHRYVQGVDPGIANDATWALTIDYTQRPLMGVRARKRGGRQPLPAIVNMVREGHLLFQQGSYCTTVVDSTGLGGKLFRQEFSIIRPLRDFDFAGTKAKKLELLSDLKAAIDRGDLRLPSDGIWREVRRQLLGYKLDDKRLEQDAVMALAIAVRHALRNPANPVENPTFDYFGASD